MKLILGERMVLSGIGDGYQVILGILADQTTQT